MGNIALGFQAGMNLTNGSSNIYIGNFDGTNESGTIRIGEAGTHTNTFIAGVNGTSVTNGSLVLVSPAGQLGTAGTLAPVQLTGAFSGDGSGLTNISPASLTGGLTTNIAVLVPGGTTNTLVFVNGILQAVQ
jgi:hypothetical protein